MHVERRSYRLSEISERFGGEIAGDPGTEVREVATLESATAGSIAFLANDRYLPQLKATRAGAEISWVAPRARRIVVSSLPTCLRRVP